jgi:hypothetical protein
MRVFYRVEKKKTVATLHSNTGLGGSVDCGDRFCTGTGPPTAKTNQTTAGGEPSALAPPHSVSGPMQSRAGLRRRNVRHVHAASPHWSRAPAS